MKIACLGWGSLIWNPKNLKLKSDWMTNGPLLPIEFSRISNDGRVTLVIDSDAKKVKTLWAMMESEELEICLQDLRKREGTNEKGVHYITSTGLPKNTIEEKVQEWLLENDLGAVIWTGLSYNRSLQKGRPDVDAILLHLKNLSGSEKVLAEEYIRNAPVQIKTVYRKRIEDELGWTAISK